MEQGLTVCLFLLGVVVLTAGCANQMTSQQEQEITETGEYLLPGTWHLIDVDKNSQFGSIYQGAQITLIISPDGNISGSSGCNRYSGKWKIEGTGMYFTPISLTKLKCDNKTVMTIENLYVRLLQETATYDVSDTLLNLTGDSATILTYQRELQDDIGV